MEDHINIDKSSEFEQAFDLLENTKQNVFLTGKAGTGKSTFLQYFREHTEKNIVVVAPTGVAALNVAGQTIHSFFSFKPRFIDTATFKPRKRKIFKQLDVLVIDEISMVRADIFAGIEAAFRMHGPTPGEPFGGIQICVIGDLYQLPPIVRREESEFFAQYYDSPFFFDTDAYKTSDFATIELQKIYRQDGEHFVKALNALRVGEDSERVVTYLNQRVGKAHPADKRYITLTPTNALAESTNKRKIRELSGETFQYEGKTSGNFNIQGDKLPAPELLTLKIGAQVMFTRNDNRTGSWVNGTLGIVTGLDGDDITVEVDGQSHIVEPEKWERLVYEFDEVENKIIEKIAGSYKQYPLTLAWAITIHKSQGKTLDHVTLDLGSGAFAPGQLYVALSRCTSLSGLSLTRPIEATDIIAPEITLVA